MESSQYLEHEDEEASVENTYLTFNLMEDRYGICVQVVSEICVLKETSPVPDVPEFLIGVINLRGQIVPVLDLRKRLGCPPCDEAMRSVTVIMEHQEALVGLTVDRVTGVHAIDPSQIKPPLAGSSDMNLVSGLCKLSDEVYVLLSPDQLLSESGQQPGSAHAPEEAAA